MFSMTMTSLHVDSRKSYSSRLIKIRLLYTVETISVRQEFHLFSFRFFRELDSFTVGRYVTTQVFSTNNNSQSGLGQCLDKNISVSNNFVY